MRPSPSSPISRISRIRLAAPDWTRRPVLPAVLLAGAVAVSVAVGQPPAADRASGVSVPVSAAVATPSGLGDLLLVSGGAVLRFDLRAGGTVPVPVPAGQWALRAWALRGADVVLTTPAPAEPSPSATVEQGTPGGVQPDPARSGASAADAAPGPPAWAYAIPRHGTPVRLGAATTVVPAVDGSHVWLRYGDTARLVGLDGRATPTRVAVPPGFRLVGATASGPVASSAGDDPSTVLLPADGGPQRRLADAEGLDVAGGVLLVHSEHRIGAVRLATGTLRWLPGLSAVSIIGPGALSPGSESFAVQARVGEHARLVVGPLDATSTGDLRVVALEGGAAVDDPPAPVWTRDGRVLAVRPDGRLVVYRPGDARAAVLGPDYQADVVAAEADLDPGH